MTDKQLQRRRGQNSGVQPAGFDIDKAISNKFKVTGRSEVVILEHSPNNNRMVSGKKKTGSYIYGFNKSADTVFDFGAFWENAFGERINLDPAVDGGLPSLAFGNTGLQLVGFNQFGFNGTNLNGEGLMTMAPDEKIILQGQNSGEGTFFVPTFDIKRKPVPKGDGGATDGNVVTIRATVTPAGVDIGPPPGRAWSGIPSINASLRLSTKVAHFGALGDTSVNVNQYLVDGDSVEYFIQSLTTENGEFPGLPPQSFKSIGKTLFLETAGVLAYPNKYRLKLAKTDDGEDPPLAFPEGRIQFLGTFQEFDLPSDAQLA